LIGLIVAVVAWISAVTAAPGLVSTFPDAISLLVLVVLMAVAFRGRLGPSATRNEVMRIAAILGVWSGAVVGVSTGIRGILRWSQPGVAMVATTVIASLVVVFLVTTVVALIAYGVSRRGQRAGA